MPEPVAGAIIGSAIIGGVASNAAAGTQARAAESASRTQWDMYNQNRTDLTPWREAGAGVLPQLTAGLAEGGRFNRDFTMEDFQKDPGYDFRMQEGMKAIERSRAARGGIYGGAGAKQLTRYGQDYASNEYGNAFNRYMAQRDAQYNRLAGLAGTGQTATNQVGNFGMTAAGRSGDYMTQAANARASGYMGVGNALSGAGSSWLNYNNNQGWLNGGGGSINWDLDSGMG